MSSSLNAAYAVDGTWVGVTSNFNDPTNWTSYPDVPIAGTATFSNTGSTIVGTTSAVALSAIQFTAAPNAPAFIINNSFDLFAVNGSGIFNNSTNLQTFNVFDQMLFGNSATASGGSGGVKINNFQALTFENDSTAGNATIANSAILSFLSNSSAGSAVITTNNGASTNFSGTSTGGTARFINVGTGTIDISSVTSPGITAGSIEGGGFVKLGAKNLAVGGNDLSTTFSGIIQDGGLGGSLTKSGVGTLTLSGANTYTGDTTISSGALNIQNGSALGSAAGGTTVAAGAALQIQGGITVAEGLTLNGTGVADSGALRNISGANTYNGAITLGSSARINSDSGILFIQSISGGNTNLTVGGAGSTSVLGSIATGTGGVTKDGSGLLYLAGTNSFTGALTINDGTINLVNGNALADTSAVTVSTPGSLSVFTSETIGSLAGSGSVSVVGGQEFRTGANNQSTTFAGVINEVGGAADLVKLGTGTFSLTGINTYTGATTISAGTLSVNGSIATSSLTTVNAGGTLGGNGIVGNTAINGGTLAPGNSIGVLNVQGNLSFTAASSYMVEVSPTGSDSVRVTGTATLGGATVNASFAAGSYVTKQYAIVNAAGGRIGTFGTQVNTNLPSNFTSALSYDNNNAYLNLALNFVPTPTPAGPSFGAGLSANQQNVADTLTNYFTRKGGIPLAFGALTSLGLTQVSGETSTGAQQATFDAMTQFMSLMTDPFTGGRGSSTAAIGFASEDDTMAYASKDGKRSRAEREAFAMFTKAPPRAYEARWNVWAAGFGGSRTTDSNAGLGSNRTTGSIAGGAVGADYWFSPTTVAGFSMAGGGTNFSVANGGSGQSDLFQLGGFVRHNIGTAYITGAAAYGWQNVRTDRLAVGERLRADFSANSYSGRIEVGNRWLLTDSGVGITPYAAVQVTAFELPSYTENSTGGLFALSYAGKTVTDTRSEFGLRSDKSFGVNDATLTLRGRAAWAHDFNIDRNVQAVFQSLPGTSFTVNGAVGARDAALTSATAELSYTSGLSLVATFDGEFSNVTRSYAGKGIVRYAW